MATVKISELPSGQNIGMPSDAGLLFSTTTSGAGSKDCGLVRGAAGTLKVTNGSTGDGVLTTNQLDYKSGASVTVRIEGASGVAQFGSGAAIQWFSGSNIGSGSQDVQLGRAGTGLAYLSNPAGGGAGLEFTEMTAPSAGASNTARLFCRDNGSGKSQLCVIFATGAIQVVATEP